MKRADSHRRRWPRVWAWCGTTVTLASTTHLLRVVGVIR